MNIFQSKILYENKESADETAVGQATQGPEEGYFIPTLFWISKYIVPSWEIIANNNTYSSRQQ